MAAIGAAGEPFHGLFEYIHQPDGGRHTLAVRHSTLPTRSIPCPETGRPLTVASVEVSDRTVCPACTQLGSGGYVSFVGDLRLAFACPRCRKWIWLPGA